MLKVNAYMDFDGQAEEAFNFYKSVFGGEFSAIHRMSDMPGVDELPENERNRLMHISLPLSENVVLMASDILPSAGHTITMGNRNYISHHPDWNEEAASMLNGLSARGQIRSDVTTAEITSKLP